MSQPSAEKKKPFSQITHSTIIGVAQDNTFFQKNKPPHVNGILIHVGSLTFMKKCYFEPP